MDSSGVQGNGWSGQISPDSGDRPLISADGRYVVFQSRASNLVVGDTNATWDVFVYDRQTGVTERVSVDSNGVQGNSSSVGGSISADGQYVVFASWASNLVIVDTNLTSDVFVYDRLTGITKRLSVGSNGIQGNNWSGQPSISSDGQYVAFWSYASNLVIGDTTGVSDVFVHDRQTGVTERVSLDSNGVQGNAESRRVSINGDGRYVVFYSNASNLVIGDTNGVQDVFVRDRQTGVTERVSLDSNGVQGNLGSAYNYPSSDLSIDGRYVVFESKANNLVMGDTNGVEDVFIHDRQTGVTERVSVDSNGVQGNSLSVGGSISADGRYVVFASWASNLVIGDTNVAEDVFVYDRGVADADGDGWNVDVDCNDNDPAIHPNAVENPYDGIDNDCDGLIDWNDPDTLGYDGDGDGVPDDIDNCDFVPNTDQADNDQDGAGDVCDEDDDNDVVSDLSDNCPLTTNPDQVDWDGDGSGDVCDDSDSDGIMDFVDNCRGIPNTNQTDRDQDGIGDVCDDSDGDGIMDATDNCPSVSNPDQIDSDGDSYGEACDSDIDGDVWLNDIDNCPLIPNPGQEDGDSDGIGNVCDNCPDISNIDQTDSDNDGTGDVCEVIHDIGIHQLLVPSKVRECGNEKLVIVIVKNYGGQAENATVKLFKDASQVASWDVSFVDGDGNAIPLKYEYISAGDGGKTVVWTAEAVLNSSLDDNPANNIGGPEYTKIVTCR